MWQPEENEILGLLIHDRVLTSVLGVLSLRRCRGRTGVSNSTKPRFSPVFCGSSKMSESCKLAADAVSEELTLIGAFGGELDCVLGSGDGGQSGGESELGMAKEIDSILHCRFTTLNPSW